MSAVRATTVCGEVEITGTFQLSRRGFRQSLLWVNSIRRARGDPTISRRRLRRLVGRAKGVKA